MVAKCHFPVLLVIQQFFFTKLKVCILWKVCLHMFMFWRIQAKKESELIIIKITINHNQCNPIHINCMSISPIQSIPIRINRISTCCSICNSKENKLVMLEICSNEVIVNTFTKVGIVVAKCLDWWAYLLLLKWVRNGGIYKIPV
jgi:hypothetical protein